MGLAVPAVLVDFKKTRIDEGGKQRLAGLPILVPQTHRLFSSQSHARHLAVFTACSRQQGIFRAGSEWHRAASHVRLLAVP
jgi:hypothetical protein